MAGLRRRDLLKGAAAGSGATIAALASPAIARSLPEIRWRLASSFPKSLDTLHGAADFLVKRIAEMTDNRFQVQLFAAGELVPGLQVLDAVQAGPVEMSFTTGLLLLGQGHRLRLRRPACPSASTRAWGKPGISTAAASSWCRICSRNTTSHVIKMGDTGGQMGGWFRKEITSLDDLKGLKFRIGGFGGRIISKLGVIPQQIAAGDVYPALEKGTLDAVEWIAPTDDEKLGFVKVAKYYYFPGWWEGGASGHCLVNLAKWNELPAHYRAVVTAAAHEAGSWFLAKYDYTNPTALKRLIGQGALLRAFSPEIMNAAYAATSEACAEEADKNPRFKKLNDSVRAFRKTAYQWWQVNELTFDTYQVRMETRG